MNIYDIPFYHYKLNYEINKWIVIISMEILTYCRNADEGKTL